MEVGGEVEDDRKVGVEVEVYRRFGVGVENIITDRQTEICLVLFFLWSSCAESAGG